MGIDLSNYVEVKDRIAEFKEKYPDGRLTAEVIPSPDGFVAVKAYAYRTPDDPVPGSGLAWEPFPGKTPYTKDSELQNAETSAWGRALVAALVADATQGVASANEVRNRQSDGSPTDAGTGRPDAGPVSSYRCPKCGSDVRNNLATHYEDNKKPAWKCTNRACPGGKAKAGGGTWGWASWDENEFAGGEPVREDGIAQEFDGEWLPPDPDTAPW